MAMGIFSIKGDEISIYIFELALVAEKNMSNREKKQT